jgi:hypothetical protein
MCYLLYLDVLPGWRNKKPDKKEVEDGKELDAGLS